MIIENATKSDCKAIYELICLKSEFDRSMGGFNDQVTNSAENLEKTLFCRQPYAKAILAKVDGVPVGLAFYHFRYSSFSGVPSIWLDDLYVIEKYRSKGIGEQLIVALQKKASTHNCSHIGWTASPNNKRGQEFYDRIGATIERFDGTRPYYTLVEKYG